MTPRSIGRWDEPDECVVSLDSSRPDRYASSGVGAVVDAIRRGRERIEAHYRDGTLWVAVRDVTVRRRRWVVGTALVVPLALVFVACGHPEDAPTTVRVGRASVSSKVTATGTLRAISEQNLGFGKGGLLKELNVTVGQQVNAGQILARIDDLDARADLQKAQAALNRARAALAKVRDSHQERATSDDAEGSENVLHATEEQAKQTDRANDSKVETAERQVELARASLRGAEVERDADDTRCRKSIGGDSRRKPGEVNQEGGLKGELYVPAPVESSACDRARKSGAHVDEARYNYEKAQGELAEAKRKRDVEHAQQRVSVESARRDVRSTKNRAEDARDEQPHEIEEKEAEVSDAEASVMVAQREVEDTVLRAPVSGKVSVINGVVGEYLGAAGGTTPLSPGSLAPLPNINTDSGGGGGGHGKKADRPGGGSFMVLDNLNTFQVVVPFAEADAARVEPNQKVDVTFDSVPDLVRHGTVVAVAPTGTNIQDVTNYYVTIVLNELDPRLKDGQTAQTSVIVSQLENVLVVPNGAIQQGGSTGVVSVLQPDGSQRQVQVQLGMVGDGVTQVLSGLREGQRVVVAQS